MYTIGLKGDDAIAIDLKNAPEKIGKVFIRSARRALTSGRAAMVTVMKDDTGLKSGDIRDAINTDILSTGEGNIEARLSVSTKRLPLIAFNAKGPGGATELTPVPSRGKGKGVTYRFGSDRRTLPHAFIAAMKSGHVGVFMRVGKGRLPLRKELRGPSLGRVFMQHRQVGLEAMQESFTKNFDHELEYALGGAATGGDDVGA